MTTTTEVFSDLDEPIWGAKGISQVIKRSEP